MSECEDDLFGTASERSLRARMENQLCYDQSFEMTVQTERQNVPKT